MRRFGQRGALAAVLSRRDPPASQQGHGRDDPVKASEHSARADRHDRRYANDVLMFRKGGFSIAMGNSSNEVMAQAVR